MSNVAVLPLSSHPIERYVLGILLMGWHEEGRTLAKARGVAPDWFFSSRHRRIYEAISDLYEMNIEVGSFAVIDRIRAKGSGKSDKEWDLYIISLPDTIPTTAILPQYLSLLDDYRRGREAQIVLRTGLAELHPFGIDEQLEEITDQLTEIHREEEERPSRPGEILDLLMKKVALGDADLLGLPTPWPDLTRMLVSLTPGALTYIGGRPSMGKTALAMGLATHIASTLQKPVAFFSLEMSSEQLMLRWMASESGVISGKIRRGKDGMHPDEFGKMLNAAKGISESKIRIFDSPTVTPASIRVKCLELHQDDPLALVVVDYLQLMDSGGQEEHRRAEMDKISRSLKLLAKELECPVVALSQLSRALEGRADRRPIPSDLRETGSLEQDADCVLFVYRDEVYHPDGEDKGTAEIIIGKQRDGALGTIRLAWEGELTRFSNLPDKWIK